MIKRILSIGMIMTILFLSVSIIFAAEKQKETTTTDNAKMIDYLNSDSKKRLLLRENYGYMTCIEKFNSDVTFLYLLNMSDLFINSGTKPDKSKYMEVLINIIASYDLDSADDISKQKEMDNLKSFKDYALDCAEMGAQAVSVMTGVSSSTTQLEEGISTAVDGLSVLANNTNNWIESLSNLETIVQDYSAHSEFLELVSQKAKDSDLKDAANTLKESLTKAIKIKLGTYSNISNENFQNYEEFFFSDGLFTAIKQTPDYASDTSLQFFTKCGENIFVLKDAWDLGVSIGKMVGNVVAGGEDLINRVLEMMALHDISDILVNRLFEIESNVVSNIYKTNSDGITNYITLSQYLIMTRIRGEYCLYSIVAKDAGLLSWFNKESQEDAKKWYDDKVKKLSNIQEELLANNSMSNNFISGKYLVCFDNRIVCAKSDGIYYKESIESKEKKIANEKNVYSLMSDGDTVLFAEGYDSMNFKQRNQPKKVYKTSLTSNTSEMVFQSDGYIELIGYKDNCIFYLEQNQSNQYSIMKYNTSDNKKSKLTTDWNGQIFSPCILGNKLYAYLKNNDNNKGSLRAYDLSTDKFEIIYSGMMAYNIFHDENRIVFDTFAISENSGNKKDNHVTYTVEKDGSVKKSPKITEDCSFEYATSDGKYGLYFSTPSSGKFDLYTIDLESGEVFTSENDAASCIGKNYFITNDLLHPEKIYFMYNLKLYDINTKSAKKISHEDFEIDITKPMWIIDGYIVDGDLNTYKIYDESIDSSDTNTVDALVEDARSLKMQNIEYAIPKILFDSPNAKQVNEEILKKYTPYFEDINAYNMQGSTTEISYTAEISQGILSICIKRHTGMETDYDVYNFDITAGTLITNEELCQKVGENYSNIQEQIVQGIRDYYGKFGSGTNKEWLESRMNESLGEENLAETKMFLEKGKIKVFYKVKALAGASYYYNELDI